MRKYLQKGETPDGTKQLTAYNLSLQRTGLWGNKAATYPLVFRDYKGGDIKDGISFFDQKFGDCDGVLFLMNPGQPVLNLGKTEDADDAALSMLTNLINGISGCSGDRKCRATAMAAAVTAMDRIRKGGDLYAHRSKFFDAFNRYIVNPLKTNASGIACKTDFKISVTGHVESQEEIKRIDPRNNAADPFLWLIDRIDRRKHPVRYWTRRLWLVFLLALLAAIGCVTWMWQHNRVEDINKEGERIFNKAQTEFWETQVTHLHYSKHVDFLGTSVTNLANLFIPFLDVREKRNIVYTNLLTKYLIATADAAYLKKKDDIKNSKPKPESDQAYALRLSAGEIETPSAFIEYKAKGHSNEVASAENRLQEHSTNKVPEIVSEYNARYFEALRDMLETNAAQVASQKYIQGLTNELAVWKQECSAIPTLSNNIEDISRRIVARCPAWRAAFASNIVQNVESFRYEVKGRPNEIFQFGKKQLGTKLRKLLTEEEPADQLNLGIAKRGLLKACRKSYFEQERFKTNAEQYPEDSELRDNLTRLLLDTTLTNCVSDWTAELHEKQRQWLLAEIGHVQDWIERAKDYSKFLMRRREGTGGRVHSLLVNCWKWADEETEDKKKTIFDNDCKKVWEQFIARYFTEDKWQFGNNYEYPIAEENLKDKIESFLGNTRITDVTVETDNWLSKMREMQKKWLIDAMEECQKFPDGFDAFKDEGSGKDIKKVLVAAKQFADNSISETNDMKRINDVRARRDELIKTMKSKYFEDDKFKSGHEFSIRESGIQVYSQEEEKMINGLPGIFATETGCDLDKITNEWSRALLQHERDWLAESQRMCTNGVCKFDGKASTIVDFVKSHSGNPFLWLYVTGVKTKTADLGLKEFETDLKRYASGNNSGDLAELKSSFAKLHQDATALAGNASGNQKNYAELYDIFALRHLCTNGTPVRAISTSSSANGDTDWKNKFKSKIEDAVTAVSDKNWLSSRYKINSIDIMLYHPGGVATYTTKWRNIKDIFKMTVEGGKVGDNVLLQWPRQFSIGNDCQAPNSWREQINLSDSLNLNLFASMEFSGSYCEEYIRRGRDPDPIKDSRWSVEVLVPHLKTAMMVDVSSKFEYLSFANKERNDPPQTATLTVSVIGEVVGPTAYDRIDACIKKAHDVEFDISNVWIKRCQDAEERLRKLNHILSEVDGSEVEGRN